MFLIAEAVAASSSSPWNSLEIAKLAVGVLTPISVIGVGYWVNQRIKKIEHLQWAGQKVIEKRLQVYEELVPLLNDLVCYYTFVGRWKDFSPPQIIRLKRRLDRIAYVNDPLLPAEFLGKYNSFMNLCFEVYGNRGGDAPLRTQWHRRKEAAGVKWKPEWENCFSQEAHCSHPDDVRNSYRDVVNHLARELGIKVRADVQTGHLPDDVQ